MLAASESVVRPTRSRQRHRLIADVAALRHIAARGVDLVAWSRAPDAILVRWCAEVAAGGDAVEVDEVLPVRAFPSARVVASLPPGPERERLRADLEGLVARYTALIGCDRVRAQLHVVTHQHCPRFHVDAVGVRLITTYAGPGTEWLPERDVERTAAGPRPRPGSAPRQLAPFEVALMKGSAWPGNRRHGVVHRSPPLDGVHRLVFSLDARP